MDSGTLVPRLFMDSMGWNGATWILLCGDLSRHGFSYGDIKVDPWFSYSFSPLSLSRVDYFVIVANNFSLTILRILRCRGCWYVRHGKRLRITAIRRFLLHGDVLRGVLTARCSYLPVPAIRIGKINVQNYILYLHVQYIKFNLIFFDSPKI